MKKKFTRYSLFGTVLVFLVVLGCKQDDFYNEKTNSGYNEKGLKIRTLKGNDAQKVADRFKNGVLNSIGFSVQSESGANFRTTNSGSGTINYDEILEVIDTLGNTNYTFRVEGYPEQDEKSFFNLVVNEKEGEQKALLLKYKMSDEFFQAYNSGNKTIEMFQGTLNIYNLDTGTNPLDGPANPCGEDIIIDFDQYPGGNQDATYPVYPNPGNSNPTNPINPGGTGGANTGGLTVSDAQIHFECNTPGCGFSSGSLSDIQNHYTPDGFTIIFAFSKMAEDPNVSEDPCGEDIGAVGILTPVTDEENCEKLNELTNIGKSNIKSRVDALKTKTGLPAEYSFNYQRSPQTNEDGNYGYMNNPPIETFNKPNSAPAYSGTFWYGNIHTHPKGRVAMFSWNDLRTLKFLYEDAIDEIRPDVFIMIVCHSNDPNNKPVYTLKINDFATFSQKIEDDWNNPKLANKTDDEKIEDLNNKFAKSFKNDSNLERAFLKDYKNYGISLYKASDNNLSNWNKLTLQNPNSKNPYVEPIPCN